ncbi:hypothetical protein [Desulfopila aestuarii]|uniref:Uncharacterized protein n=1 Tax=Desulfopila aestuarii DSM 18488 TaxID=1121416 RepID=A0A1M7Y9L4_9BACT|nr:hypothetical protein [Desulfopila aestuarii]SHO49271.1 hypothetical protein SAMN02745220_02770 [Desulfopila aestuarii DSM 18488]
MEHINPLHKAVTLTAYLETDNAPVRDAIAAVISSVQASANLSVQVVRDNRERISDATDHLDGVFTGSLNMSQSDEIREIALIAKELDAYFDHTVSRKAFPHLLRDFEERIAQLEARELELQQKEAQIEKIIHQRVADVEARVKEESTSSKWLFESALQKAEKVFDQNKITRFVCSTISRFQDEFERIRSGRDVEHVTRLFQQTIEPFQTTKMIADKNGKLTKVITNSFSEDCYQDLFLFFFKYYNELFDLYETNKGLPSTADELARIFRKKRKSAAQIIAQMHRHPQQQK